MKNNNQTTNASKSHESHSINISKQCFDLEGLEKSLFAIRNQDCARYKLLTFYLKLLNPLMQEKNKWLTIGDLYGLEASYLANHQQDATASDLSGEILKILYDEKLIPDYSVQNVENITFPDNSVDYTLCQEAFHHFPRGYWGVYEMLRVSKKAAILMMEPVDILAKVPFVLFLKNILDRIDPLLINKVWKNRFSFETVGNYVYKLSKRDLEKLAMGIGLPCIAFRECNVIHLNPKDYDVSVVVPLNMQFYKKIQRKIKFRNLLSTLHLVPATQLCGILFKEMPNETIKKELKKQGFQFLNLPVNPYL